VPSFLLCKAKKVSTILISEPTDGPSGADYSKGEKSGSRPLPGRRPTKFAPEAVRQIRNLVESGKSREEIAELIGVTVGSLQVTCSRLGISLQKWSTW
jgi:hypothetical protein